MPAYVAIGYFSTVVRFEVHCDVCDFCFVVKTISQRSLSCSFIFTTSDFLLSPSLPRLRHLRTPHISTHHHVFPESVTSIGHTAISLHNRHSAKCMQQLTVAMLKSIQQHHTFRRSRLALPSRRLNILLDIGQPLLQYHSPTPIGRSHAQRSSPQVQRQRVR
jgi:hypothetical protein